MNYDSNVVPLKRNSDIGGEDKRLETLLYLLLENHLPYGDLDGLITEVDTAIQEGACDNKALMKCASELADKLMRD